MWVTRQNRLPPETTVTADAAGICYGFAFRREDKRCDSNGFFWLQDCSSL